MYFIYQFRIKRDEGLLTGTPSSSLSGDIPYYHSKIMSQHQSVYRYSVYVLLVQRVTHDSAWQLSSDHDVTPYDNPISSQHYHHLCVWRYPLFPLTDHESAPISVSAPSKIHMNNSFFFIDKISHQGFPWSSSDIHSIEKGSAYSHNVTILYN